MQQKQESSIEIPEEQRKPTLTPNFIRQDPSVTSLRTIADIHNINVRKSKSKPKGLLLTQAAQIKKLNESLSEFKNKYTSHYQRYQTLQKQKMNRLDYQNVIKELSDSDHNKKNEIQKLSLTIRSLISSCEAYRKEIFSTNSKIRTVQDYNSDLIKKYETTDKENQKIKQQYEFHKMDSRKELDSVNQELKRNQSYLESLQKNVEGLMKRVNQIPGFQREILHLKGQNEFWRDQTERLSNQLKIMDELYIECNKKGKGLEETVAKDKQNLNKKESLIKDYESKILSVQEENKMLKEKLQKYEISLHSKDQQCEFQLKSVQEHKSQKNILETQLSDQQSELKQKNKLILSLEKQISKLSGEKTGYQQFKKNYQSEVTRLSQEKESDVKMFHQLLDQKKENENKLKFLLEQRERETMNHKKKIETLEADLIKISSELHFTEADKNIYLKQLNKYKEKDSSNEQKITKITEQLKVKTVELQSNAHKIESLQTSFHNQIAQNDQLYSNFTKITDQNIKTHQRNLTLASKTQSLEKALTDLKDKLNEQTLKNKNLIEAFNSKQKQMLSKQQSLEQELKNIGETNQNLRKEVEILRLMVENKIDEGEKVKRKMLLIETQLLEQFETNLEENNKTYQINLEKVSKEKQNLQQIVLEHENTHKRFQSYLVDEEGQNQDQGVLLRGGKESEDYRERAKMIEEKLKQLREVKKELTKVKGSLQQTVLEKEKLKEHIKKQQEYAKSNLVKASTLQNERNKIIAERNLIAQMLENKTSECQKMKWKLIKLQDELREYFDASLQTQLHSHQQEIKKVAQEKEQEKIQLTKVIESLKEIEEISKEKHSKIYQQLQQKYKSTEFELRQTAVQRQKLRHANNQLNKNSEEALSKLAQELQRLQNMLKITQDKQKVDMEQYQTKSLGLEGQIKSLLEMKTKNEEVHAELLAKATTLDKKNQSYEEVLTKLQNQFITLQLLVGELKKERNLLMRKMNFMIKGIHSTNEELVRLNSEADRLTLSFEPNSPLHEDIAKHIEIIQEAFSSLQNFKVTIVEHTQTAEERHGRC